MAEQTGKDIHGGLTKSLGAPATSTKPSRSPTVFESCSATSAPESQPPSAEDSSGSDDPTSEDSGYEIDELGSGESDKDISSAHGS